MTAAGEPVSKQKPSRAFLAPFEGAIAKRPPVWLMRQAGRYLPEYRATRTKAGSFLDLCYNPQLAAEVTLQPIRRYGFDAAILFSDILVVPDALGQGVRFVEGEGPQLDAVRSQSDLLRLTPEASGQRFATVWETVARLRQDLPAETALIGFCGSPWTVATYMVEGHGSPDQAAARLWAYRDPTGFAQLIDMLVEASITYLDGQIRAGADAIQLFDTWAGSLPPREFRRWVIEPTARIVSDIRKLHPHIPLLAFPRGAAGAQLLAYIRETGLADASLRGGLSLGTTAEMASTLRELSGINVVTQGNLDPLCLVAGGETMDAAIREILTATAGRPHIFNLGHGIVPQTPPEHVGRLVDLVRSFNGAVA